MPKELAMVMTAISAQVVLGFTITFGSLRVPFEVNITHLNDLILDRLELQKHYA